MRLEDLAYGFIQILDALILGVRNVCKMLFELGEGEERESQQAQDYGDIYSKNRRKGVCVSCQQDP